MKNKLKLIKRWKDMLTGKSTFNVKQGVGKIYSETEIKGYYNDLTNKVSNNIQTQSSQSFQHSVQFTISMPHNY